MRLAYPYSRYSSSKQADGDSVRRQKSWHEETCAKEGWQIDPSFPMDDRGKSAFKGEHLKAALGRFLQAVATGRIPRGSVLLFEELDRLSRQKTSQAMPLFIGILSAGIDIRTRDKHYTADSLDDPGTFIGAYLKLGTANEESRKKSMRIRANWQGWRDDIGKGIKRPPPGKMPPWVCWTGKDFGVVPRAADTVRLIYRLAGDGTGLRRILAILNAKDGPPTIGRCSTWRLSYVAKLLTWQAVLGEFKDATGTIHKGFYPAVVSAVEYQRAREALEKRTIGNKGVGRTKGGSNLFLGLLFDARDGSRVHVVDKGEPSKYLVGSGFLRREAGSVRAHFPLSTFEPAVLKMLREIDPREILGQEIEADEVKTLAAELMIVENAIAMLAAELDHGESPVLFKRLHVRESQQRDLSAKLAETKARAAHPLSACWEEAQAVLDRAADKEDARLRLWAALRRVVDGIWCLFVKTGKGEALAAVQMHFKGSDRRRDYLILHHAAFASGKHRKPATWEVRSLATVAKAGDLDLRKPAHARRLEAALTAVDLKALANVKTGAGRGTMTAGPRES